MNWSAFFSGAPSGFSQGMDWTQRYNQQNKMNPLQAQHQQLQNQQMQQNMSQGATTFNREGGAFDAMMRQYMPWNTGQGGQQGAQGGQQGTQGGQLGMPNPMSVHGNPPPGMAPTARPQGQSMPNMDNILAGPQAYGQQGMFGGLPSYPQQDFGKMYSPIMPGAQQQWPAKQNDTSYMQNPYLQQGGDFNAPWRNNAYGGGQ
jgi:hypothetical protein